jgi:hypothetical protein
MAYFDQPAARGAGPPGTGHPGDAARPGPPAAPPPRRPSDRPEDDSEGWEPGGASAQPHSLQRDPRREGR